MMATLNSYVIEGAILNCNGMARPAGLLLPQEKLHLPHRVPWINACCTGHILAPPCPQAGTLTPPPPRTALPPTVPPSRTTLLPAEFGWRKGGSGCANMLYGTFTTLLVWYKSLAEDSLWMVLLNPIKTQWPYC